MNGKGRTIVIGFVLATMLAALGGTASAAVTYVVRIVRVPYQYYEWETVTRYRTVRRPVTRTFYRTERRVVTTYETRRRLVTRSHIRIGGIFGRGRVWVDVRVPVETIEYVRVPYERIVYEEVQVAYTERIRVQRIGYRTERRRVAVEIATPRFSISFGHHSRPRRLARPAHKIVRVARRGARHR